MAAANTLKDHFGATPSELVVAIGPSIGPCCYEVGDDVLSAFGPAGRKWFYRLNGRWMLNLWQANRDQLIHAGVKPENVHIAELCTMMHPDLFESFRRDGPTNTGRMAAVIRPLSVISA